MVAQTAPKSAIFVLGLLFCDRHVTPGLRLLLSMLMPTSSEFIALCRSQVALLTGGLGASRSIVYLAEERLESAEARLVPVVMYPEGQFWEENPRLRLLPSDRDSVTQLPQLRSQVPSPRELPFVAGDSVAKQSQSSLTPWATDADPTQPDSATSSLMQQRQVVMPLIHDGVMMGLLVTGRDDRPWTGGEEAQIERVATTLSIACVLDQRSQWLEQERAHRLQVQEQQQDLLDNLLHQLRNPLTAIRTFGQVLLKRLLPEDGNRGVASSIVQESDRMRELLQQLEQVMPLEADSEAAFLDFNRPLLSLRPASDLPDLPTEPCSAVAILEPLLTSAVAIAQERQLHVNSLLPTDLPPVQAEPGALREVLSNLLDNAVKYAPSGGHIFIQVKKPTAQVGRVMQTIAITNTGAGIPAQDLPHIFERHYRGVQAASEITGSGLGLAIVKELLTRMQGAIEVFSPAEKTALTDFALDSDVLSEGTGTTFIVRLPE